MILNGRGVLHSTQGVLIFAGVDYNATTETAGHQFKT